jgi:hypothetical protein
MAKIITVEMPWLDDYRAILLHNFVETNLEIQAALARSPLSHAARAQLKDDGIPHRAVFSALVEANEGQLVSKLYQTEVQALAPDAFRLNWAMPDKANRNVMNTVLKAHKLGKPLEIQYATDINQLKAVVPLKIKGWGFQAGTHEGIRNYRWDKLLAAAVVSLNLPDNLLLMEIKVKGFGLRKRFSTKLVKVGYSKGERLTRSVGAYDFIRG